MQVPLGKIILYSFSRVFIFKAEIVLGVIAFVCCEELMVRHEITKGKQVPGNLYRDNMERK